MTAHRPVLEDAQIASSKLRTRNGLSHPQRGRSLDTCIPDPRPGPAFRSEAERKQSFWANVVIILVVAPNMILGSVGYLYAIMLLMFAGPASIFATGIKEIFDDAYAETKQAHP
jgi:hypothetical protein